MNALPTTVRDRLLDRQRKLMAQASRIGLGDLCPELAGLRVCALQNAMRTAGDKTEAPLCAEAPPRRDGRQIDVRV